MPRKTLPRLPSAGILLALADLELAERDPAVEVKMSVWYGGRGYTNRPNAECAVCLAGAVMRNTLRIPQPDENEFIRMGSSTFTTATTSILPLSSSIFTPATTFKLRALNYFRMGLVEFGVRTWLRIPDDSPKLKGLPTHRAVIAYEDDPEEFKRQLRSMATMLAKRGL